MLMPVYFSLSYKYIVSYLALGFLDGWYIGGVYSQGSWKWTDKSPMFYKNFAAVEQREFSLSQDVTNYAFIKKDDYKWGYVSPFGTQSLPINLFKAIFMLSEIFRTVKTYECYAKLCNFST